MVALLKSSELPNTVEVQVKSASYELTIPEDFEAAWNIMESCRRNTQAHTLQRTRTRTRTRTLILILTLTLTLTPTLTLTLGMPRTRAARAKGTTPRVWCPLSTTVTSTQRILTFTTLGR